jgi:hypothetical protein
VVLLSSILGGTDESERHGGRTITRLRPTPSYTTLWDVTVRAVASRENARRATAFAVMFGICKVAVQLIGLL